MSLKDKRLETIIKMARQAFGGYKRQIVLLTALGVFSGLLEGVGVNALIPLFSFLTGNRGGADDFISRTIRRLFDFFSLDFTVKYLLLFIVSLFIFRSLILMFFNYIKIKIAKDYEENLRNNVFTKTVRASWPYLLKQKVGYLDNILMNDVAQGSALLNQISAAIMLLTSLLIYTFIALNISLAVTLIALVFGGIIFLFLKPLVAKSKMISRQASELYKEAAHFMDENIIGMKTVKAVNVDDKVISRGRDYFKKLKETYVKIYMVRYIGWAFVQPLGVALICGIFIFSYRSPNFNVASLIAVAYLIQKMFVYIQELQSTFHSINESAPYLANVLRYETNALANREESGGGKQFRFERALEFKSVYFSYGAAKEVLSGVNFQVNKGETVGLIGPSGSGKTTIVDLILRLFQPTKGEIMLDGKNIGAINMNSWRSNIGYVSQDIFLQNDTIANNIKFYDDSISVETMEQAAKMANIHDFIRSCPNKYETVIGERGLLLSAGQRQRIIIARILARRPEILILDEATSALDNESEAQIQKVIDNLKNKITVFIIAHRLSTVKNCFKLFVLNDGEIVEQGSPDELVANKNSYFYKVINIRK